MANPSNSSADKERITTTQEGRIKTSLDSKADSNYPSMAAPSEHKSTSGFRSRMHRVAVHNREAVHGFPFLSFIAVVLILVFLGAVIVTLKFAQDTSTTTTPWPFFTPNVAISLCAIMVNTLLRHLLSEGSIISWWLTAREGATLTELHWSWEMRSLGGVFRALMAKKGFKRIRWVAVGTLVVAATAAHGVLLQRSVKFFPRLQKHNNVIGHTDIKVRMAQDVNVLITGIPTGGGSGKFFMSYFFADLLNKALRDEDIAIEGDDLGSGVTAAVDASACPTQAECMAVVRGFGLTWTGTHSRYDYTNPPIQIAGPGMEQDGFNATGAGIGFLVHFTPGDASNGELFVMDVLYKPESDCESQGYHRRVVFSPAVVSYLIDISDGSGLSRYDRAASGGQGSNPGSALKSSRRAHVWPEQFFAPVDHLKKTWTSIGLEFGGEQGEFDENIESIAPEINYLKDHSASWEAPAPITDFSPTSARYGGILTGLSGLYSSYAMFRPEPGYQGERFDMSGTLTQSMFSTDVSAHISCIDSDCEDVNLQACTAKWEDPTLEILEFINKLMFMLSLHAGQSDPVDELPQESVFATVVEYGPVYNIEWRFVIAGLIIPLVAIILVLPTYFGYWKLDRKYTGSPMEVAEAFDQRGDFFDAHAAEDGPGDIRDTLEKAVAGKIRYVEEQGRGWVMKRSDMALEMIDLVAG